MKGHISAQYAKWSSGNNLPSTSISVSTMRKNLFLVKCVEKPFGLKTNCKSIFELIQVKSHINVLSATKRLHNVLA